MIPYHTKPYPREHALVLDGCKVGESECDERKRHCLQDKLVVTGHGYVSYTIITHDGHVECPDGVRLRRPGSVGG